MRSVLKRTVERALAVAGAAGLHRLLTSGRSLVLAYHGVCPEGDAFAAGERSLHVTRSQFAEQLELLRRHAEVVPLAALAESASRSSRKPRVAITFDDAYAGAVTSGVAELAARRLPATIFVAPRRLGGHVFWWDALAEPSGGALAEWVRAYALESLRGDDEEIRAWAAASRIASSDDLPPHARAASFAELSQAAAAPGITLASHSWSHPNLARLPADALQDELSRPLAWLSQRFPSSTIPWIAYPYGCENETVRAAAVDAGYQGAVLIEGGWHREHAVPAAARPRLNVPSGVSLDGFRLRLFGLSAR